jgi:hypothetical protein
MAVAIQFYLGPYFAIDMFLGSAIRFFWEWTNRPKQRIWYQQLLRD